VNRLTQLLTLITLFGAIGVNSLYPRPEPQPEPELVIIADNELQEQICETTCEWVGEQWICWTICY
jgi:hypothetical protein